MKKFISIVLVFLCLSFNVMGLKATALTPKTFGQGIYKVSDFNFSENNIYNITNLSQTDGMFITILDEDLITMEAIRILPGSPKADIVPIKPGYRIIIVGKGNVYFTPKKS